jgi:cobalt/nickel transport system permease protein
MNSKQTHIADASPSTDKSPLPIAKQLDPRVKLVCAVAAIFAVVFMVHWETTLIILGTSIALVFYSRASMKTYLKRLLYPSYIIILVAIVQPFTYGSTVAAVVPGIHLLIFQEGISFGILVFARALAAVSVLNLLVLVTPMETIMDSLRWFKVPSVILDTMMLMYRYIAIIGEESARMRKAQESRLGYTKSVGFRRKLTNFGTLAGILLTRAFDRAMKVGDAMISRGYTGASSLFMYSTEKFKLRDKITGLLVIVTIISLVLLDLFVL